MVTAVAPAKFVPVIVTLVPTGPLVGEKLVIVGGGMTVKLLALIAVPPDVVTLIGPVVAPLGRVVAIEVDEFTVKVAETPLRLTDVTPVKFVQVIVTLAPTGPLVGEKLVIVGGGMTVKLLALVAVPPDVVTLIGPVVAPLGRVVAIEVDEFTVKLAATPLMVTDVTPVKFVPAIITLAPTGPLVGEKLVIVGGGMTVKLLALMAAPPDVVTLIGPVVAPLGRVVAIEVNEFTVKLAATERKSTVYGKSVDLAGVGT